VSGQKRKRVRRSSFFVVAPDLLLVLVIFITSGDPDFALFEKKHRYNAAHAQRSWSCI
jgi:hypothetical protein